MERNELKPCPFCGCKPFKYYSGSKSNGEFLEIICGKCKCRTDRLREDIAINTWNRRTNNDD
jgi:Lar family restriction alleviation protein